MIARLLAVVVILVTGPLLAGEARADQNDARLPALFERLHAASDGETAANLRNQIWEIWFATGEPEVDQLMEMGEAAMDSGQLRAAVAVFDAVIERRPDFAEGWNRRATVYYMLGAFERSEADVAHVLQLEPRHFGALSGLGLINTALEHYDAAIAAFERALAVDPNLPGARVNLDQLRRRQGSRGI
jgi:tetratricopeptide (TPR) repeat protein